MKVDVLSNARNNILSILKNGVGDSYSTLARLYVARRCQGEAFGYYTGQVELSTIFTCPKRGVRLQNQIRVTEVSYCVCPAGQWLLVPAALFRIDVKGHQFDMSSFFRLLCTVRKHCMSAVEKFCCVYMQSNTVRPFVYLSRNGPRFLARRCPPPPLCFREA